MRALSKMTPFLLAHVAQATQFIIPTGLTTPNLVDGNSSTPSVPRPIRNRGGGGVGSEFKANLLLWQNINSFIS